MITNGIRQQWRQMSLENEINMDIEKRVKLDADAIRHRRERRKSFVEDNSEALVHGICAFVGESKDDHTRLVQHSELWQTLHAPQDPEPAARRRRSRQEAAPAN